MAKAQSVVGPGYDDSAKYYDQWNDHRLPQQSFRNALEKIHAHLIKSLGGEEEVKVLCQNIKKLPAHSAGSQALTAFFSNYVQDAEVVQNIRGLILLLNPDALFSSSRYPDNIRAFTQVFDVQPDNLSYLDPDDKVVGAQIEWIVCDVFS